ncbi:DUF1003 domain-containing protein [Mycobacterium sp.]|uniref:DUF1003 domain-containing protein n=1 Tax=Mycobacterium sp. TaxID=1785 RepID=UPI003C720C48
MNAMDQERLNMTTARSDTDRHKPQLIPHRLLRNNQRHHPAVLEEAKRRSDKIQLRLADRITAFAGSMNFVWLHAVLFTMWMALLEKNPWPTLTLVVSLEAIFLSTFVMIGQNRQAAFQQTKADHDFEAQELELKTNTDLTRQIHILTKELHRRVIGGSA